MTKDKNNLEALNQFLNQHNLTSNSKLYRYTAVHYIKQKDGVDYLIAKDECSDMAIDHYEDRGHVFVSQEFGKGLSFLSNKEIEYEKDERICVSIQLKDVFDQGGLVYEITSLPAYLKGFFVSLPEGRVKVKREQ
jgi:hypothetical protein